MRLPDDCPKIRTGQIWRKKDTGVVVEITGKRSAGQWAYRKTNGKKKSHGIKEVDLWRFWELVACSDLVSKSASFSRR